ncbi:zinc protease [Flexibacter flexilis DSM 6793]|uniref:Zinc protease n=1 Tax=Flexibacter flexilis DSM 6793 TaxID=927664 RepID=A0A1I1LFT2_9BACT|nr:pitrilysin family protein [Flexibacter flexilis]SFC69223.1 zinc protease [Flexibacter flexilis DSM 6793]
MIDFQSFTLDNGLRVYVHSDHSTPTAVLNILYNVGSRDEDPNKTGFAHLFEHLMFGGSQNVPSYDEPLQRVGGENNAFTSPDITNYYITVPSANLETAFWLESDRMLSLSFDPQVLEVQRKVVIEEFNQRYLNQPYGDVWLKLRPLAYTTHPYNWATIGKEISHIENATMEDVKAFFYKYYLPNNAVMVVAGDVTVEKARELSEKWFAPIPAGAPYHRNLPQEPVQTQKRSLTVSAKVPTSAIYKAYHACARTDADYHATDLLSDILGRGKSSRLYQKLVKELKVFTSVNAYVMGSIDAGLLLIDGKVANGISLEEAEKQIDSVVAEFLAQPLEAQELTKVKNQAESSLVFGEVELLNRAMSLAFFALLGNPDQINREAADIQAVSTDDIKRVAAQVLRPENCSVLYYQAEK